MIRPAIALGVAGLRHGLVTRRGFEKFFNLLKKPVRVQAHQFHRVGPDPLGRPETSRLTYRSAWFSLSLSVSKKHNADRFEQNRQIQKHPHILDVI